MADSDRAARGAFSNALVGYCAPRRQPSGPDRLPLTGRLTHTDADGAQIEAPSVYGAVPPLTPGAYLVEARDGYEGATVTGRAWILVTPGGERLLDSGQGVGAVFVGADGLPVEVSDLAVNGRSAQHVSGGAVVAPLSSFHPDGTLVFRNGERLLGALTVPGPLSRLVPVFVDDSTPPAVVSWAPLPPGAGHTTRVLTASSHHGSRAYGGYRSLALEVGAASSPTIVSFEITGDAVALIFG